MGIHEFTVNRIYELCKERKITPNALSYMAGIPQATVKSILHKKNWLDLPMRYQPYHSKFYEKLVRMFLK